MTGVLFRTCESCKWYYEHHNEGRFKVATINFNRLVYTLVINVYDYGSARDRRDGFGRVLYSWPQHGMWPFRIRYFQHRMRDLLLC